MKNVNEEKLNEYSKHYDRNIAYSLLKKLRRKTMNKPRLISGPTGKIIEILGALLSALENPETPPAQKALIIGAIGYIILPIDIIPDYIPGFGWTDDILMTSGLVALVAKYSTFNLSDLDKEIKAEINEEINAKFGE